MPNDNTDRIIAGFESFLFPSIDINNLDIWSDKIDRFFADLAAVNQIVNDLSISRKFPRLNQHRLSRYLAEQNQSIFHMDTGRRSGFDKDIW
jgi:hypothetical protein